MDTATRSNLYRFRDPQALLHPYTDAIDNENEGALVMARGDGIHVWDETGKEYIEGMAGLWCVSLGFGNERLADAAHRQMRTLPFYHGFNRRSHEPQVELAERLKALAPVPMARTFFANSGSEAIDTAIKLIWFYNNAIGRPAKKKIVGRKRGYHGITAAAASVTGVPANHAGFDLPFPGFLHTDCPHYRREGRDGETEEEYASRCAESLERLILAEGPETIAAFFAEPVMGAGGVIIPPATYFEKIQQVLRRYDVLFAVDEVICGFGRTGNFWGSQTFDLEPDLLTMAKALSSGYLPIAAVQVNEKVYRGIAEGTHARGTLGHGFTYSGHPVPAAVALETLAIYDEMDLVGQVARTAPHLQRGVRAFADHPLVGEVAGIGMVAVIELVADKTTGRLFDPVGKVGSYLMGRAEEHGLIVRALGDRAAFSPPLIIAEDEIGEMLARFGRALDDTASWVADQGLT